MGNFNEYLTKKAASLSAAFLDDAKSSRRLRAIIYGLKASGKTSLALTAPPPIYIHSWDPGGCILDRFAERIKSGEIIADTRWEKKPILSPSTFREWTQDMDELIKNDVFKEVNTFVLDGMTTWFESLMAHIVYMCPAEKTGKISERGGVPIPLIQHYVPFQSMLLNLLKQYIGFPCNVIATMHAATEQSEVTGETQTSLNVIGSKTSEKVMSLFPIVWYTKKVVKSDGAKFKVLTQDDGYVRACTRLDGAKALSLEEEPDIQKMIAKLDWE